MALITKVSENTIFKQIALCRLYNVIVHKDGTGRCFAILVLMRLNGKQDKQKLHWIQLWPNSRELILQFSEEHFCHPSSFELNFWIGGGSSFFKKRFFYKQRYCLTVSWFELQMLLRCCLIHVNIIIHKHFMFNLFVSMPSPKSVCTLTMWSFCFPFHFHK